MSNSNLSTSALYKKPANKLISDLDNLLNLVSPELKSYIEHIQLDDISTVYAIKYIIKHEINEANTCVCSICGRTLLTKVRSLVLRRTCGDKTCRIQQMAQSNIGKQRPEFAKKISAIMQEKSKRGTLRTKEHRAAILKGINTIAAKKAEIISCGEYSVAQLENLTDDEIISRWKICRSNQRKSLKYKTSCVSNFYNLSSVSGLSYSDIEKLYADRNSLKSTIAALAHPDMGCSSAYKRIHMNNIPKCTNKTKLTTRSKIEADVIMIFENSDIISSYKYEPAIIHNAEYNVRYIPDFIITYNDKDVMFEVKGVIRDKSKFELKTKAAIDFCNSKNLDYYIFPASIYNVKDLTSIDILMQRSIHMCTHDDINKVTAIIPAIK